MESLTLQILAVVISGLALGLNILLGLFVRSLDRKTSKIDTMERELDAKTGATVDLKLAGVIGQVTAVMTQIGERVHSIEERLQGGDHRFALLADKDHSLEIKVLQAISELKDVVATKDDLNRLREEMRRNG